MNSVAISPPDRLPVSRDLIAFSAPHYEIRLDGASGILHVLNTGLWDLPDVDRYIDDMAEAYRVSRTHWPYILMLADLSQSPVQKPEVSEHVSKRGAQLYIDGDRVALLAGSSLMKMQLRRTMPAQLFQPFLSVDAAMRWLLAWRSDKASPAV